MPGVQEGGKGEWSVGVDRLVGRQEEYFYIGFKKLIRMLIMA